MTSLSMLAAVLRRSMAVRIPAIVLAGIAPRSAPGDARWSTPTQADIDSIFPDIDALYVDLHRNPELGFQETRTAATLAARLKALGFDVTTGVGKTGVVGVVGNRTGPTVMLRAELDALPVEEKTGLPFAGRVVIENAAGQSTPVMYACAMAAWAGKMTSEDFSEYGLAGVPSALLHIGAVHPSKLAAARQSGVPVPAPHSPEWAPEREPTLTGAIRAETTALLELLRTR